VRFPSLVEAEIEFIKGVLPESGIEESSSKTANDTLGPLRLLHGRELHVNQQRKVNELTGLKILYNSDGESW
jgi:hypothetical protein